MRVTIGGVSATRAALLMAVLIGSVVPIDLTAQTAEGSVLTDTVPTTTQRLRPYTGMIVGGILRSRAPSMVGAVGDPDLLVMQIEPGSPSEAAGLQVGDAILEVDGVSVHEGEVSPLSRVATGVSYLLRVRRGEQELELTLVPGPLRPAPRPRIPR